ncbi:MAG TPA: hypothetical protein VIV62_01295 [Chthoniobacterales bacterium]|jgi:hypothetical protein
MRLCVNQILFLLLGIATVLRSSADTSSLEGCVAVSTTPSGTQFKIITPKGFVGFSVGNDWPVIAIQSKLPVAAAGFQIPNAADENTADSTNLAITLYDQTTIKGRDALAAIGKAYGGKTPTVDHRNNWTIYTQESKQGDTFYTVFDAKSKVADVAVAIRLAWPHLANNAKDYDKQMTALFRRVLDSIHGSVGPYKPKPNEVIRRPTT